MKKTFQTLNFLAVTIRELPRKQELKAKVLQAIENEGVTTDDMMKWYNDERTYQRLINDHATVEVARRYRIQDEKAFTFFFPEYEGLFLPIKIG